MRKMNTNEVFQADSIIVNACYRNNPNYLIETDPRNAQERYGILYFSSHNIYYPNNEETFLREIEKKNTFEWYKTRIAFGAKHIFLRDIKKQWYLTGINHEINDPEKLLGFLKKETEGYKVITLGSSAGGYAAALYGSLLGAEKIYTFNGQFELNSILKSSSEAINPIVFRERHNPDLNRFYDLKKYIEGLSTLYYFYSKRSKVDRFQHDHVRGELHNVVALNTGRHGVPFLKCNAAKIISLEDEALRELKKHSHEPILLSIKLVGWLRTLRGICEQFYGRFAKRF